MAVNRRWELLTIQYIPVHLVLADAMQKTGLVSHSLKVFYIPETEFICEVSPLQFCHTNKLKLVVMSPGLCTGTCMPLFNRNCQFN